MSMKKYLSSRSVGFYISVLSLILSVLCLIFYITDVKSGSMPRALVLNCLVIAIALGVVMIALSFVEKLLPDTKVTKTIANVVARVIPIACGALVAAAVVTYVGERVDILGYILTDHYSFFDPSYEMTFPYLAMMLIFGAINIVVSLIACFFQYMVIGSKRSQLQ